MNRRMRRMMVALTGGGAAGPVTLVSDTFTDADTTNLSAHTPDTDVVGGGWQIGSGAFTIDSNQCLCGTSPSRAWIETNQTDVTIESDVITVASGVSGGMGVCFRVSNANNLWYVDVTVGVGTDNFRIVERNAGSDTVRAQTAIPGTYSTTYAMTVVLEGDVITATLDGGDEITYTSAFLNDQTKHGIIGVNTSRNDNLVVSGN